MDDEHIRTAENTTKLFLVCIDIAADVPRGTSHQEQVVADSGSGRLLNRGGAQWPAACVYALCEGKPNETVTEAKNGPFEVLVRSQEFHHSGTINVDVCVTESSNPTFPKNEKLQCFLHGYDFSGLSVKWLSQHNIEIAFDRGRVTTFTNSAFVYPNGPVPVEFHATLRDGCAKQVP